MTMRLHIVRVFCLLAVCLGPTTLQAEAVSSVTPEEAEAIAEEAYIYAYPMLANYRIMHAQAIDRDSGAFRAPFNQFVSSARLPGGEFQAGRLPNNDVRYDFAWLNLEAEPMVLNVPTAAKQRYYSFQFVDMYTHNFAYVGSRETGYGDGRYLIAGPYWSGKVPPGIARVLRSEGNFVLVLGRTQFNGRRDIESINTVRSQYKLTPLSVFLGKKPEQAPQPNFPSCERDEIESAAFIRTVNFLMGQMRQRAGEASLLERFARIGIGPNRLFEAAELDADLHLSIQNGVRSAMDRIEAETHKLGQIQNAWQLPYGIFGTYEEMQERRLVRAAAAMVDLYGPSHHEAFCPVSFADAEARPFNGSQHAYTIEFDKDTLPPVRGFWSISLYSLPERRFVKNAIGRYSIGSRTDGIRLDADGVLSIRIQHGSPGESLESNWLPAPAGPFCLVLRLYWPGDGVRDGAWAPPAVQRLAHARQKGE
jgi:hypothetical protein